MIADGRSSLTVRLRPLWSIPLPDACAFCTGRALLLRRDRTMLGGNQASDKALQKLVDRRLQRSGALGLRAVVVNGSVTMTGQLKYENQRIPLMKALRGVSGVENILDQVQAPPKLKPPGSGPGA